MPSKDWRAFSNQVKNGLKILQSSSQKASEITGSFYSFIDALVRSVGNSASQVLIGGETGSFSA